MKSQTANAETIAWAANIAPSWAGRNHLLRLIFCGLITMILTIGAYAQGSGCVAPPPNMALWLPFDEASGPTSANLVSPVNGGTQINGPQALIDQYVENSLSFNGLNQSVSLRDYPAIDPGIGDLTIDAWVNRATNSGNDVRIIVDKRDVNSGVGYSLSVSFSNLIFTMSGVDFRDTGTVPADGRWHFVAVSVRRGEASMGQFYVDGNATGTFAPIAGNLNNTHALWVGASALGGNQPWLGDLDEVQIFNRALATVEIQNIFNAGSLGTCKPLSSVLQAVYGGLPSAQFTTGILVAPGVSFNQSVLNSNGTTLSGVASIPSNRVLSGSQFLDAYNTLRMSSVRGNTSLPDLAHVTVTIDRAAKPVTLAHNLAFQDIYALALAVVPFNTIASGAFDDGRLRLVKANPVGTSRGVHVVQGSNPAPYVQTKTFAGVGSFRTVLQSGNDPIQFMLPKELLVTTGGAVDKLQIRFPGAGREYSGFVDIYPNQVFLWDFSTVTVSAGSNSTKIQFVIRASIDRVIYDSAGEFTLQRMAKILPTHNCATTWTYHYPPTQPSWWPNNDWNTGVSAQAFFTSATPPSWWGSSNLPWPLPYGNWNITSYPSTSPLARFEGFGEKAGSGPDAQVFGPLYYSTADGSNSKDGYNLRYYPATYKVTSQSTGCLATNLVLIVDGIDILDDRTEANIWNDFGLEGAKMLDKGYDLLVLNYMNGRDPIQRNALALLTVLQNSVPGYMAAGHENDRVAIIAASMGTQVTRYALETAENGSTDHHTGLAIYLDGPFLGANMPWSVQGLLGFLARNEVQSSHGAQLAVDGLNSPAARQLLKSGLNLAPDQAYTDYYNEVAGFPYLLPRLVRNVAVACGSGVGYSQVNTLGTFPPENFAYVQKGPSNLGFAEWGQADISALTEGTASPPLTTLLYGGIEINGNDSVVLQDGLTWDLAYGDDPRDLSPGGWTPLSQMVVDAYNAAASPPLQGMTGIGINAFIPTFSSLYVRSAELGIEGYVAVKTPLVCPFFGPNPCPDYLNGPRPASNYYYGPESNSGSILSKINPTTVTDSPFDAIWYQYKNVEHVVTTGEYLPPGYEAFVFNELDQFTSQEPFSSESVLNEQPKMPLHDVYLAGNLLGPGFFPIVDELLTINTITRRQMVQVFASGNWEQLVDNTSKPGWIGSWAINKGDKFFLAQLTAGGPKLLVSFSAATPAWAMVQQFVFNGTTFYWKYLWSNNGNGQIGNPLYPTPIRPTNIYAFGDPDGSGYDILLIAYPYVGNDYREKMTPGTSGLSQVTLLMFDTIGGTWDSVWSNWAPTPYSGTIDFLGATAIRFGDQLMFGRPLAQPLNICQADMGTVNLFSLNLLRGIFGNSFAYLQYFCSSPGEQWFSQWTDNGVVSQQGGGCTGNFGCWRLGNPRDSFYFADLDGNGVDELIAANDAYWQASIYDPVISVSQGLPSGVWSLHPGFADPGNGSMLGIWRLGIGDRFVFGHFSSGFAGDLVLSLNPLNRLPIVGSNNKLPVLQQWTLTGWVPQWIAPSTHPRSLGNWTLYQDLP
jgi:hypothetical protein